MSNIFARLVLPTQLHGLPDNYAQRIEQFGAGITARQHMDRFMDFIDLQEVDNEDAKMRLFYQSFSNDVMKWLRGLQANSIVEF